MILNSQTTFKKEYLTEFEHDPHFKERLDERFPELKISNFNTLIDGAVVILDRPNTIHTLINEYSDNSLYLYKKNQDMVIVIEKTDLYYKFKTKTVYRASGSHWVGEWLNGNPKINRMKWVDYRASLGP
jgi:hypothetical protein